MAAYQKGDADAFAALVTRHERPLWSFVRRFVGDRAAAEDALQEVYLRVVRGAGEWRPEAKVSTWVYTIARNVCTDLARRKKVRPLVAVVESGEGAPADVVAGGDRGGEAAVMDREAARRIEAAVAALPVDQREVFLMREVMEMPFAEIAAAVGASEPTVKSRMRYALLKLRETLDELKSPSAAPLSREAGQAR